MALTESGPRPGGRWWQGIKTLHPAIGCFPAPSIFSLPLRRRKRMRGTSDSSNLHVLQLPIAIVCASLCLGPSRRRWHPKCHNRENLPICSYPILQNKKLSPEDPSVTCLQAKNITTLPFQSLPFSPIPSSSSNSLPPVPSPSSPPKQQPHPRPSNKKSPNPTSPPKLAQTSPATQPSPAGPGPRPPTGVRTYHPPRHRPSMEASAARVEDHQDTPLKPNIILSLPTHLHTYTAHDVCLAPRTPSSLPNKK